jgi:hypothetical protein
MCYSGSTHQSQSQYYQSTHCTHLVRGEGENNQLLRELKYRNIYQYCTVLYMTVDIDTVIRDTEARL